MQLPRLADHRLLALTVQLTAHLAVPPVAQPHAADDPVLEALKQQWRQCLSTGVDPSAPVGLDLPLATPPNATVHAPLCALEILLACWSDDALAWGLETLGFPDLGGAIFPGLAATMAASLAAQPPAGPAPAVFRALGIWRGRGGMGTTVDGVRPPMDLWEVVAQRLHRSAGPASAEAELPPAQHLLDALVRCGLSWQSADAPEALCASVAKAWECYPSLPVLPGFQRALLEAAPPAWWPAPVPVLVHQRARGQTLLEQVAAYFPAGPCRQGIVDQLSARAAAV